MNEPLEVITPEQFAAHIAQHDDADLDWREELLDRLGLADGVEPTRHRAAAAILWLGNLSARERERIGRANAMDIALLYVCSGPADLAFIGLQALEFDFPGVFAAFEESLDLHLADWLTTFGPNEKLGIPAIN